MIDIVSLIQSRGVSLTKRDGLYYGTCPFHEDASSDSLIVNAKDNTFSCEDCHTSGDTVSFIENYDGISNKHAQELIKEGGEAVFMVKESPVKKASARVLSCLLNESSTGQTLLIETMNYYHEHLLTHQPAIDYLTKRGLYNEDIIKSHNIGFADRSLGLRLPTSSRKAGKELRKNLIDIGIYRPTGHAHFNGCITIPITSSDKVITNVYGCRVQTRGSKNKNPHLTLNDSTAIFNVEAFSERTIILCDSVLNALTFLCHGFENATCVLSDATLNQELLDLISERRITSVYLALPANEQSEKDFMRSSEKLKSLGVEVYHMKFPWNMDANSLLVKKGQDSLAEAHRSAVWLGGELSSQVPEVIKDESPDEVKELEQEKPSPVETLNQIGEYYHINLGECSYRIGGLHKNNSMEVMKVTLRVAYDDLMHVDSLDLYKDADRRKYIDRANEEVLLAKPLLKRDLARLLMLLEKEQEKRIYQTHQEEVHSPQMTGEEKDEALALLNAPDLIERICQAFMDIGLVGSNTNKLASYLALVSRKLSKPLAVVIQSSSASGKSALMDGVLSFFPREEQLNYSAITGQSLFYQQSLKNKILAISEEIGFERAGGSLKLLQSQGYLSISSTSKDAKTGKMTSIDYHVEGPIALIFTTTSINLDEELMNRCLVLNLEEDESITRLIHDQQRHARTLEGLLMQETKRETQALMQNIQRLIKPYHVINTFAPHLTFSSRRSRTRRDHEKYLTLIDSIALLRQFQKSLKVAIKPSGEEMEYIEVELADIELANSLAPEIFGHSLDELPPQTRRLLTCIQKLIRDKQVAHPSKEPSFTRKEVRERIGWSETQARNHIQKLEAMEYIIRRSGKTGSVHCYNLLVHESHLSDIGIIDTATLKNLTAQA